MLPAALPFSTSAVPSSWISANAGSGKTSALVDRVVGLLLRGVTPERICCITYTKAAAGEMRERILRALRQLLVMDDIACAERITSLIDYCDDATLALARSLFARVLDSPYGGLQLTTIHGFCQLILRRFPLEANLSPQFTVLEDTDSENLQRRARQRVLSDAQKGGELSDALMLVATRGGEHAFAELVRHAAAHSQWWHALARNYPLPELLREAIFNAHGIESDATDDRLCEACCELMIPAHMEAPLRAVLGQFTSVTDAKFAPIFTAWLDGSGDKLALLDALQELFFTQKGEPAKRPFTQKAPLPDFLDTIRVQCVALAERRRALACAEESYASALVARAFLQHYERLKTEQQALDYEDLILRTEQLLAEHSGWVMSRLDHRIDHLLVDEAQDTSPGQWRIVRTLVEELMVTSGGMGSGNLPRSLLVVGDEKQSIFSFQGADPKQFAAEAHQFAQLLGDASHPFERRELKDSYRSANAILQVVDAVAALPPVARALSAIGTPNPHQLIRNEAVGRVVLHPPMDRAEKQKPEPFTIPTQYLITQSTAQQLADSIAAQVADWVGEGRYAPGDILILLWRRQPLANCLIRALERANIPVAGIDRLKLAEHLAVRDLMALMGWCGFTGDDLALAQVLRSPIIGMSGEQLEDIAWNRTGTLWDAVKTADAAVTMQLNHFLSARHQSPYDFLTHVLEVNGARMRYAARFGEEVHEVLDELKAQATSMPQALSPTITAFHDWITRSEREVKRQQEARGTSVRIMTVHGSKGLEAPVVILADTARTPTTARETSLETSDTDPLPLIAFSDAGKKAASYLAAKEARKQQLFDEYYRLLYVALTRARDVLHIFTATPVQAGSWYELVQQAMAALPTVEDGPLKILQDPGNPPLAQPTNRPNAHALPDWAVSYAPGASRPSRVLSPSRLAEAEPVVAMAGQAGANVRGVRIHRILQFLSATSTAEHIAQLTQLAAPEWDDATRAATIREIAALHAAEGWLWQHRAIAEASIGGTVEIHGEAHPFSGQIDRLILTPTEVIIVDYKTGAHIPQTAEAAPISYKLQLKLYRELLAQLYPGKTIRSALLWSSAPRLMWMDDAILTTEWPILSKN